MESSRKERSLFPAIGANVHLLNFKWDDRGHVINLGFLRGWLVSLKLGVTSEGGNYARFYRLPGHIGNVWFFPYGMFAHAISKLGGQHFSKSV